MDPTVRQELATETGFMKYMGDDRYYTAVLDFFVQEISNSSWQLVVQRYVCSRDERADAMLIRLFDSFLHPIIHLGFGIEFEQPAIIAEALAQTACHQGWIAGLLLPAEIQSKTQSASKSQVELLDALQQDEAIRQAPQWTDADKIKDGVMGRAGEKMIHYLAQIKVDPEDLASRTAEMMNAATYLTAAAQRPGKAVKFDFYLLHCLTAAMFFPTFIDQTWLSEANKARLLEAKMRMDLVMYVSRKSPTLRIETIRNYESKHASELFNIKKRACLIPDDGHAAKLIRAILRARDVSMPFQSRDVNRIKMEDWDQVVLMAIDSMEISKASNGVIQHDGPSEMWVRSAGFDEAWASVPDLE